MTEKKKGRGRVTEWQRNRWRRRKGDKGEGGQDRRMSGGYGGNKGAGRNITISDSLSCDPVDGILNVGERLCLEAIWGCGLVSIDARNRNLSNKRKRKRDGMKSPASCGLCVEICISLFFFLSSLPTPRLRCHTHRYFLRLFRWLVELFYTWTEMKWLVICTMDWQLL